MKKWSVKLLLFISIIMIAAFAAIFILYNHITRGNISKKANFAIEYMLGTVDSDSYLSDPTSYTVNIISTDDEYYRDEWDAYLKYLNSSDADASSFEEYLDQDDGYDISADINDNNAGDIYGPDDYFGPYDTDDDDSWFGPDSDSGYDSDDTDISDDSHISDDTDNSDSSTEEDLDTLYPTETKILEWYRSQTTFEGYVYYIQNNGICVYTAKEDAGDGYYIYYIDVSAEMNMLKSFQLIFWIVMALCIVGAGLLGMRLGLNIERDQQKQKQFFENASHDLKTPLMAIQGYAEGLENGVISDTSHAYHVIMEESQRMASLVDEIMLISKLESGNVKLNRTPLILSDLVEDCLMGIEYQAGEKHTEIHINVAEMTISADKGQMERAITNLLSNALRHACSEINIFTNGNDLIIWNDCEMLSAQELTDIFARFHSGKNGNTGIGLSLTKEIVERHGWKITAENANMSGKDGLCMKIHF